jgi:hypothetical protein
MKISLGYCLVIKVHHAFFGNGVSHTHTKIPLLPLGLEENNL